MASKVDITEQLRRAILRELRKSDMTKYMLAKDTGVNWSVIDRFVSGERGISLETAAKLCEYLKLDLTRRR
jgi:plasmid maintenance system antidote protein VapI